MVAEISLPSGSHVGPAAVREGCRVPLRALLMLPEAHGTRVKTPIRGEKTLSKRREDFFLSL